MDWSDVAAQLTGVAHLATATPDGRPYVAVVSAAVEGESIWIMTSKSSRKARNLAANPQLSIMWQPQAEVYVQGTVELIDALEEKRRLWSSGLLSYDPAMFFGTPENPDILLVKVTPVSAMVQTMGEQGPQSQRWRRA